MGRYVQSITTAPKMAHSTSNTYTRLRSHKPIPSHVISNASYEKEQIGPTQEQLGPRSLVKEGNFGKKEDQVYVVD